jgi:hypothetical protein
MVAAENEMDELQCYCTLTTHSSSKISSVVTLFLVLVELLSLGVFHFHFHWCFSKVAATDQLIEAINQQAANRLIP